LAELRSFYESRRGADFELLAVNLDSQAGVAERFTRDQRFSFPVLLDPSRAAAKAFRVQVIPSLFVINKQGVIEEARPGVTPAPEKTLPGMLESANNPRGRGAPRFNVPRD